MVMTELCNVLMVLGYLKMGACNVQGVQQDFMRIVTIWIVGREDVNDVTKVLFQQCILRLVRFAIQGTFLIMKEVLARNAHLDQHPRLQRRVFGYMGVIHVLPASMNRSLV